MFSCEKWEERVTLINDSLGRNLLEQVSTQPDLSKFQELLVKSG